MPTNIPSATGVPGISGPPNWLSGPGLNTNLDDVRWRGATQRTFAGGASPDAVVRIVHDTVTGQNYIFLSFRAAFVPELGDQYDTVYLGLQKHGGTKGMVIRLQLHDPGFVSSGPPSANPPANLPSPAQISTWTGGPWQVQGSTPTWIDANARAWVQAISDNVPGDPNNRWAIQVRIPVTAAADIVDNSGPNLGTDFDMWYLIRGTANGGNSPVLIGEFLKSGGPTLNSALILGNYPAPTNWDEFLLTSGPGTDGGVALQWNDIGTSDGLGINPTSSQIKNGMNNKFVARPRNYTPATINPPDINATFRLANWGSVCDPNAPWDYIPGNSAITPVNSSLPVSSLPPNGNPPNTDPIVLDALMNLGAGKSTHQCMLVTLSGTSLNFLNDSVSRNMDFDHASLLERDAEISLVGLKPFSAQPRDVYLALEKVNMQTSLPGGSNEKAFLGTSMERLMERGGPLAEKLKNAQGHLRQTHGAVSTDGSQGRDGRLRALVDALSDAGFTPEDLDKVFPTCRVHVYHDTGERVTGKDGKQYPVLRAQSSFGFHAYHEGPLEGWQTSIQGAQRIADNLYQLVVPNNGTAKITTRIQAVQPGEKRIPEDPIRPKSDGKPRGGCLWILLALLIKPFKFVLGMI